MTTKEQTTMELLDSTRRNVKCRASAKYRQIILNGYTADQLPGPVKDNLMELKKRGFSIFTQTRLDLC